MSAMEHKESYERFYHGLRKASSRMRELAGVTKNKDWLSIAASMEDVFQQGKKFYASKPLTDGQVMGMTEERANEAKNASLQ